MPRLPDAVTMRLTVTDLVRSGRARELRTAAGLSRSEAAGACGVSETAIGFWETGTRSPRGDKLVAYWRLLSRLQDAAPLVGR